MRSRAYSAKPEQQTNGSVHILKGLGQNRLTGGPTIRSRYLANMGGITMKQHNKLLLGFALGVIPGPSHSNDMHSLKIFRKVVNLQ